MLLGSYFAQSVTSKRNLVGVVSHLLPALLVFVALLLAGCSGANRPYLVIIDNEELAVRGQFETVAEVLRAVDVSLYPEDTVWPEPQETVNPGGTIRVRRSRLVTVRQESGSMQYRTQAESVGTFLIEAGIEVGPADRVVADGEFVATYELEQQQLPALLEIGDIRQVTIVDGPNRIELSTSAETVGQLLNQAGVLIHESDRVDPPPGSWLSDGLEINISRAKTHSIYVDGQRIEAKSHNDRVFDILSDGGVALYGNDYAIPDPNSSVRAGESIQVIRVSEDYATIDQAMPYETVWQATDELELDQKAQISPGVPGILRQRLKIRYENGVRVAEEIDAEWVARDPVNEVMGYGTRVVVRTLETEEGTFEYWRVVRMRVTAYTAASAGKPPDHPGYGITASGVQAGTGVVAIDPKVVPFRSWVYVPGYGVGFAGDTGGGVKGRWIDLGYDEGALVSWNGYVDVYYLTPVPELNKINYLIPTVLP